MLALLPLTFTLLMTLAGTVKGGYLIEDNTWGNIFYGEICADAPPWNAVCGWRLRITSNPPLTSINPYEAIATEYNGGELFLVENQHWNAATPQAGAEFCVDVQIGGTFGNTKPDYVNIDWDCICVTSTCDPVPSANQATTSVSSAAMETTLLSATGTATTDTTPATQSGGIETPTNSMYLKHAGKCHQAPAFSMMVPVRNHCFLKCLHVNDCQGVSVTYDSSGFNCSFVNIDVSNNDLAVSADCDFWERL